MSGSHTKSKLNEHDIILDEMIMILIVFYCLIPSQQYSSTSLHHSLICDKGAKINLASDLCPQCLHILVSYCPKRRVKQITEFFFHPVFTLSTKVCKVEAKVF